MTTNEIQLIQKFGDEIDSYILTVAEKTGEGVSHFWPIFVKQQVLGAYCYIGIWFVFLLICLASYVIGKKLGKESDWDNNSGYGVFYGFSLILIAVLMLVVLFEGSSTITTIFNPEYKALKEVIEMIK